MNRRALVCLMASVALAQGCSVGHPTFFITGCPEVGTTVAVGETVTFMSDGPGVLTVGIESGDAEITLSTDGSVEVVPNASGTITIVFVATIEDLSDRDQCTFEASAE